MSTTKLDLSIQLLGREIFDSTEAPAAASEQARTLSLGSASVNAQLGATSTPKIDKSPISLVITIGGGITTINLTALAGLALPPGATRTLDMTGAKVVAFLAKAKSTNAAAVNIAPGASNPYPLFGTGNDIDLGPGRVIGSGFDGVATNLPAVAGGVKTIDISGTTADVLYLDLYLGT